MGRLKKAPERSQRHGESPELGVIRLEKSLRRSATIPMPERGWLAGTVRAWTVFWSDGIARLTAPVDELAVRRLFALYDARERVWKLFLKAPQSEGSMGQPVLNAMGAFALQLDTRLEHMERAFGITPKARMALGITFAEAKRSLEDLAQEAHQDVREAQA